MWQDAIVADDPGTPSAPRLAAAAFWLATGDIGAANLTPCKVGISRLQFRDPVASLQRP